MATQQLPSSQPAPDPDYAYNQLYAAMKAWGRFNLVDSPSSADLILEVRLKKGAFLYNGRVPPTWDYQIALRIFDPKTHFILWPINEHVKWASRTVNMDKNVDQTIAAMVNDIKKITPQSAASDKPVE